MRSTTFTLALLAMAASALAQFPASEVSGLGAPPFHIVKSGATFENLGLGIAYNIYRRIPGEEFRCLAPDLPTATWPGDPADPPLGQAWWYTVNGYDGSDENRHGSQRPIEIPCHLPTATLTVEKLAMPTMVAPGADFTFTITVSNTGTVDALNVRIGDVVDATGCMTLKSCDSSTPPLGAMLTCAPPSSLVAAGLTIPASTLQTIVFTATAGLNPGTCDNTVTVTGDNFAPLSANAAVTIINSACTPVPGTPPLRLVVEATGLTDPVHLTHAPGDSSRLFVVERPGTIRIIKSGTVVATPFLDIVSLVLSSTGNGERGFLSMAFHPDYASNGLFYVYYTRRPDGATEVVEYRVSADPDVADPTARILFNCSQPFGNHNGGQLAFSPRDGYLYIGLGDGGSADDPGDRAENLSECLGKILRVDVDGTTATPPLAYRIPPDNPFVGVPPAREEIWSYALRNPWRFSFDRLSSDLYIADVGQGRFEEVDVQPAMSGGGEDYGWDTYEGTSCHEGPCAAAGKVFPVTEYGRTIGSSITGGHVYRGCRLPGYHGTYFYADFASNRVFSFVYDQSTGMALNPLEWTTAFRPFSEISSFGEDADGEIYVVTKAPGIIYKISD